MSSNFPYPPFSVQPFSILTRRVYLLLMYRKANAPFKPPRLLKQDAQGSEKLPSAPHALPSQPPPGVRKRLKPNPLHAPVAPVQTTPLQATPSASTKYYTVQWRKRSNKKNKSWEGDGYIVVTEDGVLLKVQTESSYKVAGRSKKPMSDGVFSVGIYEVEVDCETSKENLHSGPVEHSNIPPPQVTSFKPHRPASQVSKTSQIDHSVEDVPEEVPELFVPEEIQQPEEHLPLEMPKPAIPNAKRVAVEDDLAGKLRAHQREGVLFIYECLMGLRNKDHQGCLLADEMGLGKTLMTISVLWTMLKQSPYPSETSVAKKVLICCPVSLIDNWRKEFGKWINPNRIGVLSLNDKTQTAAKDKQNILSFGKTKVYQVLIMSYEKILSCAKELSTVSIDVMVCDEGHRLKNSANKVLKVLKGIPCSKRLLLTGTPIQNDLLEFYNVIDFINPGILGDTQAFQREFLKPIARARDVNCFNDEVRREGRLKSAKLIEITKQFTIRRTKAVIEDYLTAKTDVLLFCAPSKLQQRLFDVVKASARFNSLLDAKSCDVLSTINLFRKICNSPSLLAEDALYKTLWGDHAQDLDPKTLASRTTGSKMNVLIPLLIEIRAAGERVVLVSNFTQTLDLLERSLSKMNFRYVRLDGSTPLSTRDTLVTTFNKSGNHDVFLLSSKAGGVGLNLVGASRLILFDNDWNPLVDLQAMARIHRDGQAKPVFIYRLFTTGCIDEKIFQRQLMKNNLSDMFLDDNLSSALNIFDFDDLRDLFSIADTTCNTHDLLECDCNGCGEVLGTQNSQSSAADLTDEDVCPSSGWMSALDLIDLQDTNAVKKKAIRSALSSYRHFDPGLTDSTIEDTVLAKIMKKSREITYIFSHQKAPKS